MSADSVVRPPGSFSTVRGGKGFRREQVDAAVHRLADERDAAWERAARLTVLAKDMEAELIAVRAQLDSLGEQSFAELGDRAQFLLALAEEEAVDLLVRARAEADQVRGEAEGAATAVRSAAQSYADELTAEAEARYKGAYGANQQEAEELLATVRDAAEADRREATEALEEMRRRTAGMLDDSGQEWKAAEAELALEMRERAEQMDAELADRAAYAKRMLAESQAAHAAAEEDTRGVADEAAARCEQILAEARVRAERIEHEAERGRRDADRRREELQAHMEHIRSSLTAITGRHPDGAPESGGSVPGSRAGE
ncbi:hypothetical protein [Streptomyces boninensis]|uniref:hypothetical protein n=1 Tax=Streptomyces boninensis TaxID=2039455 RepID=UPI003B218767